MYSLGMRRIVLFGIAFLSACTPNNQGSHLELPTAAAARGEDVFKFKIGALDAVALNDGDIHTPNDQKALGFGQSKTAVDAVLTEAKLSTETLDLSIQPLLVHDGARTILFDTGAGAAPFAVAGHLPTALRSAGVLPSQVTDIFLSHSHPDHTGGLTTRDGAIAFPNATIHLTDKEWLALKANKEQAVLVAAIEKKVVPFVPGSTIFPSVTAVAVPGHTPGHSAYDISSGSEHLLYVGDSMHHFVISVERPDWTVKFDQADAEAKASRKALLQRASTEHLRLYAVHFPFPGIGTVRPHAESFQWVPER